MKKTEEHIEETHEEHEGLIKTPKQLIVTVILAFIVPIVVILLLVSLVDTTTKKGIGSDSQTPEAIANRIKPVAGFALVDANAPKVFKTGQQVLALGHEQALGGGVVGDVGVPLVVRQQADRLLEQRDVRVEGRHPAARRGRVRPAVRAGAARDGRGVRHPCLGRPRP